MNRQAAVWYEEGISKLVSRQDKCLSVQGDYVEKQVKVCDKTCIFCFFPIDNKYLCMAKRSLLSRCPSYYYLCYTQWVVAFRSRQLYLQGGYRYLSYRRLGGTQGWSGHFGEEKFVVKILGRVKVDGIRLAEVKDKWRDYCKEFNKPYVSQSCSEHWDHGFESCLVCECVFLFSLILVYLALCNKALRWVDSKFKVNTEDHYFRLRFK